MITKGSGGSPKKRPGRTPDGSAARTTTRRSRNILTAGTRAYAEMAKASLQDELMPAPDTSARRSRRGKRKG